ncbi:hypothetical protein Trydic_g8443, partial [Trypoxylus dichotomus]
MNKKKYNTRRRSESLQNLSHYFSSCSDSENDDENLKIKQNTDHHKDIFRKSVREKVRRSIITRNLNEFVSSTPLHSTRKTFNNTVFISPITEETEPVAARTTQHSTSSRPQDHNNKTKFTETKGKDNHTSKCIFPTSSTKNAHNSVLATILQSNNSSEKCTNSQKSNGRNNKSTRTNVRKTFSAHRQTHFSPRLNTISKFQNRIVQTVMDKGTQIADSLERYSSSKDKKLSGANVQNFLADEDNYSEDNDATLTNQKSSLKPKEFVNKKTKKNGTLDSIRQSPGMSYLYNVHSNKEDILNDSRRLGKSGNDQSDEDDVSWLSSLLSPYLKNYPSDTSSFSEKSNKNNEQGPPTKRKNKKISRNSKSKDSKRKQSVKATSNVNLSEDKDILGSIQPAVRSIHDIENDIDFVERNSTSGRKNTTRKRKQSGDRSLKAIEKEHNEEGCDSLRRSKRKRKDRDTSYRPEIIFTSDRCLINCTKANRALQVSVNLEMAKISRRVGSSLKKQTPSTPQDSRNTHSKKKQFRRGKVNDIKILEEEESQMIIVNKDSCQKNISHDRIDKSEKETNNYEKEKTFENTNENYQENNPTEDMIAEEIDNNTEINTNTDQLNNIMDLVGTLHAKSKFQNLGSSRDYFYFPQNNAVNKIPWCFVNPPLNYIDKRKCLRVGVGPKSSLCGFKSGFLEILPDESKPRHIAVKFSL